MKIVQPTPDLLILQQRWRLTPTVFLIIFSLIYAGSPLSHLLHQAVVTFSCYRISPHLTNCQLTSLSLLNPTRTATFKLQGARLEKNQDRDGDDSYQTILLTDSGDVNWNSYSSFRHSTIPDETAQIEEFIHNLTEKSLTITERDSWLKMFFSLSPFIGGGLLLGIAPFVCRSCCTFDRKLETIVFKHRNWLTDRVIVCSIYDVKDIEVKEKTTSDNVFYINELVLSSGERQNLTGNVIFKTFVSASYTEAIQVSKSVRKFLNLKPS